MPSNEFTKEQIIALQCNPYTFSVTPKALRFTLEFKEFYLKEIQKPGMNSTKIFRKAGYDESLLSMRKCHRLANYLMHEARSSSGIQPPKGKSKEEMRKAFAEQDLSRMKTNKAIEELQKRVVYLEESIDFLKKIQSQVPPK